jgi:hypothetical protein
MHTRIQGEKQLAKKMFNIFDNFNYSFFVVKEPFKNDDVQHKQVLEYLGFLIVKIHFLL